MVIIYVILGLFLVYQIVDTILKKYFTAYGITFIAGEIGAGKSTFAVKLARKHMKKGWTVYSTDYIEGAYKLDVNDLNDFMAPPKSLLIIDEASLKMNSREFAKTKLKLIEYFKLSRHCKNKVIMISQTFTDTDKQIRDLSTDVFFVRKIINGILSVPVRVIAKLGVGQDGQPCMMYKIGHFGVPLFLPLYFKKFNSFDDFHRGFIRKDSWQPELLTNIKGDIAPK